VFDIATQTGPPRDWRIWAVMALIGLFGTLVAHGLFVLALRTIRPSTAGILATAEPVFAGLIAFLVLGDRLQPLQLLGAGIIVAGIVTVQAGNKEPPLASPAIP
jgi:drug/metabolite transporter (DMT)-like permease